MKSNRFMYIFSVSIFLASCSSTEVLVREGTPYKDLVNATVIQFPVAKGIKEFSWAEKFFSGKSTENDRYSAGAIYQLINIQLRNQFGVLPINARKIRLDETNSILSRNGIVLDSVKDMKELTSLFKKLFPQNCYILYPTDFHLYTQSTQDAPIGPKEIKDALQGINSGSYRETDMFNCSLELTLINLKNDQVVSKVVSSSSKSKSSFNGDPIQSIIRYCAKSSLIELFGFAKEDLLKTRVFSSQNNSYSAYLFKDSLFFNSNTGLANKPFLKPFDTMAITNSGDFLIAVRNNPFTIGVYDKNLIEVFNANVVSKPEAISVSDNSEYFFYRINGAWNVLSLTELKIRNDIIKTGILKSGEQFYCILTGETDKQYSYISLRNGNNVSLNKSLVSEFK